jgi:DNA-binding transcriptional MocR family regulator
MSTSNPSLAARTAGLEDPVMRMFQSALARPGLMSFGAGFMNPAGFDVAGVRAAFAAALADEAAPSTLQYGLAEGSPRLRDAIVERMADLDVPADASEIIVTTGATQALDLLCNALLDPGDVVLVERPTYVMPLKRFALAQARVVSIPGDEDGIDPVALEAAVLEHCPKVIYTIPTFQNPSGTTLTVERRQAVAQIAERHGIWVIEDEPYRELYYDGEPAPAPIARYARESVIYIGTLAKTVAPGLRVGWVVEPRETARALAPVKQAMDFNTSTIDQAAAAIYLEGVDWARRTSELRAVYAGPMRAMIDGLAEVLPAGSTFTRPRGGIFVWAELPEGWSTTALLERAIEHGMFFMPGSVFLADVEDDVSFRLSVSNHTPESVSEGMGRLAAAIAARPALSR